MVSKVIEGVLLFICKLAVGLVVPIPTLPARTTNPVLIAAPVESTSVN